MDQPTNYEPSTSATRPQDQVIHLDGPIVMSRAEILAKQLELNAKRLDLADKQINLANKQLELDEQQRKLDDEQRELNGQSSVSIVFELMASASARTTAIPVVDAPTESISPCPPIAALPSLLVAALPAARPAAAQEGKRPAPINELPESPIAPKRHRGKGQISNAGSMTGSSPITCHRLSEKVAVERLIAALDIPALVAPAAGTATFGNAPAIGVSALDFSALVAPAAGATTFGIAPAAGVLDRDISALIAPAAGATTFGVAPATGILDRDFSALIAPAAGATTFGVAPAAGVLDRDISALVAPAAGILDRDFSALVAPAAGATTFGVAPATGILDRDFSALIAPAAGATTFGVAPAAGVLDRDISALVAPAAGVLDRDFSALVTPAAGATTFGNAPAVGILDRDFSALITPAAGTTTFGNAPAIGVPALDFSGLIAPATGAPTFGVAPTAGVLDCDISALVAPAAGASIFGDAPTIGAHAADFSAYVAPVDAAQFAAILNADQPIDRHLATQEWVHRASRNNASESSQVVKRQRLDMCVSDSVTATNSSCMIYDASGMICDVSGVRVTSERLLVALGEAPYVSLGYVLDAYSHIYGCELMPSTAPPQECIVTLASVVALEHWAPQLEEEDTADLNILCRRDLERTELRRSYLEQLGLAKDANATVLGPRLCFVVVRMCQIPVDLLTGTIISSMFMDVTGLDLHSLNVVTENGVRRIKAKKLCRLVKKWVGNLVKFIADDGNGLEGSLSVATACNAAYSSKCSSASSDSTEVALSMLRSNKLYSTLFLGNGEAKWGALFRCLVYVSSKRISPRTKECLEQLSTSLQVQSGS
ncbi:hypothetical protein GGI03_006348 [Coemansia sp. RSA 2337]|nr:hypothetical protein GGI03_006348 [Coemansia sp. RSA 2337]